MSFPAHPAKGINDQKTLNEELIEGVVEVARRQPQHAVELFGIPLGVATRLAAMPDARRDDLATTPAALWRPAFDARLLAALPEWRATPSPLHETYRPVIDRLNRLALATFSRHADDRRAAALVCHVTDPATRRALQELPSYAFLEWGGNAGVPLVVPTLTEPLLDRLLRTDEDSVDPTLRALLAWAQADDAVVARTRAAIRAESAAWAGIPRPEQPKRSGRPPANFLMPGVSTLILTMLRHQMRPAEVEDRLIATSDVRAAQLRGLAESLNPRPKRDKGAPRDRTRDHRDLWGSAHRRLVATAIFAMQRRLIDAGQDGFEAMVDAFDWFAGTIDGDSGVSLSRMLRDVFEPLRAGAAAHLGACTKCGVMHLMHEEKAGIIECPVCVLARAGRYGQRRARPDRLEAVPPAPARPQPRWSGGPWGGQPQAGAL